MTEKGKTHDSHHNVEEDTAEEKIERKGEEGGGSNGSRGLRTGIVRLHVPIC